MVCLTVAVRPALNKADYAFVVKVYLSCRFIRNGRYVVDVINIIKGPIEYLGELYFLFQDVIVSLIKGKFRWNLLVEQIAEIGFRSQPVVIITGAFTGAVLAAQSLFQFKLVNMETAGGGLVSASMFRELGPTITALMLAGRVGSSMAAEIGTMKVSEQIDALRSMSVHPIDYLVTPRVVAIIISIPILVAASCGFAILASYVVGVHLFKIPSVYWNYHVSYFTGIDEIIIAMTKGLAFGLLIVLISCHQGLKATNGAVGVGRGTTKAMVYSSLAILIVNFFLSLLMQRIFPAGFIDT